ncbi:ribosomal protein L15 [Elysia marginata]|uniref:Ribosomal protein L15 n=1 Tax=Elysia marginata TaxID=1093978 RepID=A0AAV4EHK8_9GAST|nr:ribosomal protein L15 [Elysia marginata]
MTCNNCGRNGHRSRDPTRPANGKTCNACGKANHFSSVCRSKPLPQRQSNNKLKALRSKPAAVHKPFHHTIELLSGTRYVTFSAEVDTGAEISGVTENSTERISSIYLFYRLPIFETSMGLPSPKRSWVVS